MNIAISYSLRFAENMLNVSLGNFKMCFPLFTVIIFTIIFQAFFLFLNDEFTFSKIRSICLVLKTSE